MTTTNAKSSVYRNSWRCALVSLLASLLFTCARLQSPQVIDSYPTEFTGFTDIRPNIYLTFSTEMNHEATQNAFALTSDSPVPKGAFQWSGNTMFYRLESDLEYGGRYTVKLLPSAESKDKNKYLTTFLAHFYAGSDLTVPQVQSTNPVDLNMNVALNTPIVINFSRAMSVAETEAAFQLSPSVAGLFSWNVGNTVLTYTPFQGLTFNQQYTVTIARTAKDSRGMPMVADYVFRFKGGTEFVKPQVASVQTTGGTAIYPGPTANTVEKTEGFVVTFDEPMDYLVTQSAFSLVDGQFGNNVAGTFSWLTSFTGFTFQPTSPLTLGREYYLRVSETAKDSVGNPLQAQVYTNFFVNGLNSQPVTVTQIVAGTGCVTPATYVNTAGNSTFDIVTAGIVNQLVYSVAPAWTCEIAITFSAPMKVESVPDNISITRVIGNDSALVGAMTLFTWNAPRTILNLRLGSLGDNVYQLKIIGTSSGVLDQNNNYMQSDFSMFFRSRQ